MKGFEINLLPIIMVGFLCWCIFSSCNRNTEPRVKTVVKYVYVDSSSIKTRTEDKTIIETKSEKYRKPQRKEDKKEYQNTEIKVDDIDSKADITLSYDIPKDITNKDTITFQDTLSLIHIIEYKRFLGIKTKKKNEEFYLVSRSPYLNYVISDVKIVKK